MRIPLSLFLGYRFSFQADLRGGHIEPARGSASRVPFGAVGFADLGVAVGYEEHVVNLAQGPLCWGCWVRVPSIFQTISYGLT